MFPDFAVFVNFNRDFPENHVITYHVGFVPDRSRAEQPNGVDDGVIFTGYKVNHVGK